MNMPPLQPQFGRQPMAKVAFRGEEKDDKKPENNKPEAKKDPHTNDDGSLTKDDKIRLAALVGSIVGGMGLSAAGAAIVHFLKRKK